MAASANILEVTLIRLGNPLNMDDAFTYKVPSVSGPVVAGTVDVELRGLGRPLVTDISGKIF